MPVTTLDRRSLNRATLARQMLLVRARVTPVRAVERLAGMQAQLARPPYIGLWSRLAGFRREQLTRALLRRDIVRVTSMRGTLHLMSARDYLAMRGALQPALTNSTMRDRAKGIDVARVTDAARRCFAAGPRTFAILRGELAGRFPKLDERAMAYVVRMHLPLVQVPVECDWGYPGQAEFGDAEAWLGRRANADEDAGDLVLRYLAAFGPATVADAQTWSSLRGLAPVFERLRPRLATFRDERGRELFDLPKAPRPKPATAAPVRFVPEFDNLVLAHADRTRIVADEHRKSIVTGNLQVRPTFLVDGFVAGTWNVERKGKAASLRVEPFEALPASARKRVVAEAELMLRFVEPDAESFAVRLA